MKNIWRQVIALLFVGSLVVLSIITGLIYWTVLWFIIVVTIYAFWIY